MEINFKYGTENVRLSIQDKNIIDVIGPKFPFIVSRKEEVIRALRKPINSPCLNEIVSEKKPKSVVILVTDISRPIPYGDLLPEILKELLIAGITEKQIKIIIATGAHRANKDNEIKRVFGELASQYTFLNHNCDINLLYKGTLSRGLEIHINRYVAEADFVITTGCIMPHNLAGYSGGPKLILPGVAGRKTIEDNHSLMNRHQVGPGKLQGNPIQAQILEAAKLVGVDFSVNVVLNEQNQIIKCFAGDMESSWLEGCKFCQDLYRMILPEKAAVVIAGAGGYPRDLNLYQSVKALVNSARLVKANGTIILVAKCQEGLGEPLFKEWMNRGKTPTDIRVKFEERGFLLGAHKAYILCKELENKEVILVSDLANSEDAVPLIKNVAKWEEAEKMIVKKHGSNYRALILPFAGLVFPLSDQAIPSNK